MRGIFPKTTVTTPSNLIFDKIFFVVLTLIKALDGVLLGLPVAQLACTHSHSHGCISVAVLEGTHTVLIVQAGSHT